MPDKKPTDAEIVKALECCIGDTDGKDCFGCPLYEIDDCQAHLNLAALDLINRLQAKLDEAEDTIQFADKELKKANAENERLKDLLNRHQRNTNRIRLLTAETAKKIKAEAYKECIEKVKAEINKHSYGVLHKTVINFKLDNLLKEMAGDKQCDTQNIN